MKRQFFAFALCSCVGVLHADIHFEEGNIPSPGGEHDVVIHLNKGTSGTTVTGEPDSCPNKPCPFPVDFTSIVPGQTLFEPNSGASRVAGNPENTAINGISITVPDGGYGNLVIDPHIGGTCPGCAATPTTVTVIAVNSRGGLEPAESFPVTLKSGSNFFAVWVTGGEQIRDTIIQNTGTQNGMFHDLRQPRISGVGPAVVPEPSTYAPLMALALAAFALFGRSRKKV